MNMQDQQMGFITGSPAPTADERQWGMFAHLSILLGLLAGFMTFLGPLIVLLTKGKESAWVGRHAKEALNFQLTMLGVMIVSLPLMLVVVGFCTALLAAGAALVVPIIAGIQANEGKMYRYPFTVRLLK